MHAWGRGAGLPRRAAGKVRGLCPTLQDSAPCGVATEDVTVGSRGGFFSAGSSCLAQCLNCAPLGWASPLFLDHLLYMAAGHSLLLKTAGLSASCEGEGWYM